MNLYLLKIFLVLIKENRNNVKLLTFTCKTRVSPITGSTTSKRTYKSHTPRIRVRLFQTELGTISTDRTGLTSERVHGGRVLKGRDERLEVEERRRGGPAERAELVLVVQPVPAHGGQLPALGHEHDEQHERRSGAQAQRQATVLVAGLRGPQPGHGPADAQRRRAPDGQPDVHGLPVVVPDVPRLDGQHGDGQ